MGKTRVSIFPFFELSQEIRDQIYHELWLMVRVFLAQHNGLLFAVSYCAEFDGFSINPSEHKPNCIPAFRANKQFLLEAVHQLQRCAIWRYLGKIPKGVKNDHGRRRSLSLLHPLMGDCVAFPNVPGYFFQELISERTEPLVSLKFGNESCVFRSLLSNTPLPTKLRRIHLESRVNIYSGQPSDLVNSPFVIDWMPFKPLMAAKSLQTVEWVVEFVMRDQGHPWRLNETIKNTETEKWVREGADELASMLIGGSFSLKKQVHNLTRKWLYTYEKI